MPEVGGVVHTHSTYATAWAARGEAIPCVLTMIADEFGGDVPVGPFALIGDDSIGRGIVETLRESRSKAVLMRNHGPFTVGKDARSAVKTAVMVEDVARTVHLSRQLGEPVAIASADVDALYDRYQNVYGQGAPAVSATYESREVWFLTGSQHLYGPEVLDQVAANAADIVRALDSSDDVPVRVVTKPVLTETAAIRRALIDAESDDACVGVIAWMHTFSPAKMWITGLDHLRKPLLHLHTQANQALPWAEIDMDFMNLNQAAHGDREFAAVQTRLGVTRKTVAGHVQDPEVARRVGVWARAAVGRAELSTMKLARFGDNMRNVAVTEGDKVEAERRFGVSVNTWGVNDLVAVVDEVADADIDALVTEYADTYDVPAELLPGGERHESLRYGARIEARPAAVPDRRRLHGASRRTSRTSAGCASCRAWPCSG